MGFRIVVFAEVRSRTRSVMNNGFDVETGASRVSRTCREVVAADYRFSGRDEALRRCATGVSCTTSDWNGPIWDPVKSRSSVDSAVTVDPLVGPRSVYE